jgi:hypothetical protein
MFFQIFTPTAPSSKVRGAAGEAGLLEAPGVEGRRPCKRAAAVPGDRRGRPELLLQVRRLAGVAGRADDNVEAPPAGGPHRGRQRRGVAVDVGVHPYDWHVLRAPGGRKERGHGHRAKEAPSGQHHPVTSMTLRQLTLHASESHWNRADDATQGDPGIPPCPWSGGLTGRRASRSSRADRRPGRGVPPAELDMPLRSPQGLAWVIAREGVEVLQARPGARLRQCRTGPANRAARPRRQSSGRFPSTPHLHSPMAVAGRESMSGASVTRRSRSARHGVRPRAHHRSRDRRRSAVVERQRGGDHQLSAIDL